MDIDEANRCGVRIIAEAERKRIVWRLDEIEKERNFTLTEMSRCKVQDEYFERIKEKDLKLKLEQMELQKLLRSQK
jgi:tetrahydromethanopterin S-methyltransferase subunit G